MLKFSQRIKDKDLALILLLHTIIIMAIISESKPLVGGTALFLAVALMHPLVAECAMTVSGSSLLTGLEIGTLSCVRTN